VGKERPLEYVPAHTSIRRHIKTRRFSRELGHEHPEIKRHWLILELYLTCAEEYPTGQLPPGILPVDIAEMAGWPGDGEAFVDALRAADYLRELPGGGWEIVSWEDYAGKAIAKRRSDRGRKRDDATTRDSAGIPRDEPVVDAIPAESHGIARNPPESAHSKRRELERETSSCVLGRDQSLGALQQRLESEFGYAKGLIRSKWQPLAAQLAPYTLAEIDQAIAEAKVEKNPGAGLVISILDRVRNTKPETTRARAGPRPERSAFREATEDLLNNWANDGQAQVSSTHDAPAGLLPAAGR
jgi:hypothetical protein